MQLHTQLKQVWNLSLQKIQAWTGFQPMTSAAIPTLPSFVASQFSAPEPWAFQCLEPQSPVVHEI